VFCISIAGATLPALISSEIDKLRLYLAMARRRHSTKGGRFWLGERNIDGRSSTCPKGVHTSYSRGRIARQWNDCGWRCRNVCLSMNKSKRGKAAFISRSIVLQVISIDDLSAAMAWVLGMALIMSFSFSLPLSPLPGSLVRCTSSQPRIDARAHHTASTGPELWLERSVWPTSSIMQDGRALA
jgi:hypothetical protein